MARGRNLGAYLRPRAITAPIGHEHLAEIKDRTVSVFQCKKNPNFPDDDIIHQQKYIGPAPQS
jgi:hypothetical protein